MAKVDLEDKLSGLADENNFLKDLYDAVYKALFLNPLKFQSRTIHVNTVFCCIVDFDLLLFCVWCFIKGAA